MLRAPMPNRFYIWELGADQPREFRPGSEDAARGDADLRYFLGVAAEIDRQAPDRDLLVLLTWHLDRFEDRFEGAVVLLINDEQYQLPSYAGRVRAIFKTGGVRRNPWRDTLRLHPAIAWRTVLRELRNIGRSLRRRLHARQTRGAPVHQLPLGYFRLTDVPAAPFAERPTDVFFAGSVESARGFTLRPRLIARRQMSVALEQAGRALPDAVVDYSDGGPMANPGRMVDGDSYSRRLADARIVLCPRGNFDETYRLMEAARCGCVTITERLPSRWYYRDCPAVQLDRWARLPDVLATMLADPDELAEHAARARRWWDETLSESAIASFVVAELPVR